HATRHTTGSPARIDCAIRESNRSRRRGVPPPSKVPRPMARCRARCDRFLIGGSRADFLNSPRVERQAVLRSWPLPRCRLEDAGNAAFLDYSRARPQATGLRFLGSFANGPTTDSGPDRRWCGDESRRQSVAEFARIQFLAVAEFVRIQWRWLPEL